MALDPIKTAAIKAEIGQVADAVGAFLPPQALPFYVLGRALAVSAPDIIADIQRLLAKTEPTDAEEQALAVKIHALASPESL